MDETLHCALTGDGALKFAESVNFPTCEPAELISDEAESYREDFQNVVNHYFAGNTHDTVTAVALDSYGHFACATSTG